MNDSVGELYTLLPDSVYTVPNWKVTIPKASTWLLYTYRSTVPCLANGNLFICRSKSPTLSGVTISANFGNGYWLVAEGNAWVGLYHSNGI